MVYLSRHTNRLWRISKGQLFFFFPSPFFFTSRVGNAGERACAAGLRAATATDAPAVRSRYRRAAIDAAPCYSSTDLIA